METQDYHRSTGQGKHPNKKSKKSLTLSLTKIVKTAAVGKEWKPLRGRSLENVSFVTVIKR